TFDGSTPVSAAILRTDGGGGMSFLSVAERGFGSSSAALIGMEDVVLVSGLAVPVPLATDFGAAPAPSLILPSTAPTATVSPCLALISPRTPADGAGTSSVTLSVSSSTS